MDKESFRLALSKMHVEEQYRLKSLRQELDDCIKENFALSLTPPHLPRKIRDARRAYSECVERIRALSWALRMLKDHQSFDDFIPTPIRATSETYAY
jgi:hypothetical protein